MAGVGATLLCCVLLAAAGGEDAPGAGMSRRWAAASRLHQHPSLGMLWGGSFFGGGGGMETILTPAMAVTLVALRPAWGTRCLPGLRLCRGLEVLRGLQGQSVSFPAPLPASADIARVIWRNWETHIAEAKPRENRFNADYLPGLRGRLFLHPTRLSLEIRPLQLEDSGPYQVIVDTFSEPTNPKNSSYFLIVHGESKDGGRRGPGLGLVHPRRVPVGVGCHCVSFPAPSPASHSTPPLTMQSPPPLTMRSSPDALAVGGEISLPLSVPALTRCTLCAQPRGHPAPLRWGTGPHNSRWPPAHAMPCAHSWLTRDDTGHRRGGIRWEHGGTLGSDRAPRWRCHHAGCRWGAAPGRRQGAGGLRGAGPLLRGEGVSGGHHPGTAADAGGRRPRHDQGQSHQAGG